MTDNLQTQRELSELTTRVANVEQIVRFGLAASDEARNHAKKQFKRMKHSPELYLQLKEPRTQAHLRSALTLSHPRISELCTHLEEQGFIAHGQNPQNRKELVFHWTEVERILGLSQIARECVRESKR